MRTILTKPELCSLGIMALLTLVGLTLPAIAQPEAYHHFADQRTLWNIPHFCDVVSNLVFTLAGALGLTRLQTGVARARADALPLATFFLGLTLTGFGSAYYHWAPTTQTLFYDRLPMVIAFAGIIGAFLTQKVSTRIGRLGLGWALGLGLAGMATSVVTGSLTLYLTLQFGGLLGMLTGLVFLRGRDTERFPWGSLMGWYALAKVLELGDQVVWDVTLNVISGHTLKHLAAGMAGVVVLKWLAAVVTRSSLAIHKRASLSKPLGPSYDSP